MKTRSEIKAIIICLIYIIVCTGLATLILTNTIPETKDAPKAFFICCVEKLSSEYYTVVYATKKGDCHYPHFTHIRQAQAFIDYLETLGTVDRNGYEVSE